MKKCPYCGHEQNDQNKICERCYAGLPDEKPEEKARPVKRRGEKSNKESE